MKIYLGNSETAKPETLLMMKVKIGSGLFGTVYSYHVQHAGAETMKLECIIILFLWYELQYYKTATNDINYINKVYLVDN